MWSAKQNENFVYEGGGNHIKNKSLYGILVEEWYKWWNIKLLFSIQQKESHKIYYENIYENNY